MDTRKWLLKPHNKDNDNGDSIATVKQHNKDNDHGGPPIPATPSLAVPEKMSITGDASPSLPMESVNTKVVQEGQQKSGKRKRNIYVDTAKSNQEDVTKVSRLAAKRKVSPADLKPPPVKKPHMMDDDCVPPKTSKSSLKTTPIKNTKTCSGKGISCASVKGSDDAEGVTTLKPGGRGRGRSGAVGDRSTKLVCHEGNGDGGDAKEFKSDGSGGRGRSMPAGDGRGGFMVIGRAFVIYGKLDSFKGTEAESLIKGFGGHATNSISKKTNYLLCDEDVGGKTSAKVKEPGTFCLTKDQLFDMIRASKCFNVTNIQLEKIATLPKASPQNEEKKEDEVCESVVEITGTTHASGGVSSAKRKKEIVSSLQPWTEKYKPKRPEDVIGNETLVKNLYKWLRSWKSNFLIGAFNGKGGKQKETSVKNAVLLSGASGIGKTTSAKLVSQMLGFRTIELNASDNEKCMNSRTAIPLKELVSNQSLSFSMKRSKHPKVVLIIDEVDAMVAADNGGLADLISSIKVSKVPIICICNDQYSKKLKGLVRFCSNLGFQKPTFLEMANRLKKIANSEGLKVTEMTLKELAQRVNGDMRMALNQLQYLSLKSDIKVIGSNDIKQPDHLTVIDKLFGRYAYKLNIVERLELSSIDTELVPLNVQENYINYRPNTNLPSGKFWEKITFAADSISSGDMIDVQMRRCQERQLLQSSSVITSVIPASHLHGFRNILEHGERNLNRFGAWLEKNSTTRNNYRLLVDISVKSKIGRSTMRLDYLSPILECIAGTLKMLPKDKAVEKVVEFMGKYSISLEDVETLILLSKFQGRPNPLDGFQHDLKAALAKAYNEGSKSHVIPTTDLIELSSLQNKSDAKDLEGTPTPDDEEKLKMDIESISSKGIQMQRE